MRLFTLPLCEINGASKVPQRSRETSNSKVEKSNTLPKLSTGFTMVKDKITKLAAIQGLPPIDSFSRKKMNEHAKIHSGPDFLSPFLRVYKFMSLRTCKVVPSGAAYKGSRTPNRDNLTIQESRQIHQRCADKNIRAKSLKPEAQR